MSASLKKKFLFRDRIVRGISAEHAFQVVVVKTTDVARTAQKRHHLQPLAATILAKTLTAALLLASDLKGEERLSLKLEGNGSLKAVVAESNAIGAVRGFVQNPNAILDIEGGQQLGDGLGLGVVSVSKVLYDKARPVTGTVQLIDGAVDKDIAHFLLQSEQIRSAVRLDVGLDENGQIKHSGGLIVRALPGAEEATLKTLAENVANVQALNIQLGSGIYIDRIMKEVSRPFTVRELKRGVVDFFCSCNEDRFVEALSLLPVDELDGMRHENQTLTCHYCNQAYSISKDKVEELYQTQRVRLN